MRANLSLVRDFTRCDYIVVVVMTGVEVAYGHRDEFGRSPCGCIATRAVMDDFGDLVLVRGWL